MKIIACIKQVPDTEARIKLQGDGSDIDPTGIKWIMNPYDEFAVEEALKVKQAHPDSTVTVISVGPKKRVVDVLRTALAMGADDAVVVDSETKLDAYATAKALAAAIKQEGEFGVIFTGRQAIDDNAASVSQMLAEFLGIPHATVISKLENDGNGWTAGREVEGGTREVMQLLGAPVIGANKGLNTPRYASLPGIMKAKKKPLKELSLADVGSPEGECRVLLTNYQMPPEKPAVKMLAGDAAAQAKELVHLLKDEAKVL